MELVFRALGLELSVVFGPQETEPTSGGSLSGNFDFGFAPDPVFPELDWGEEE